MFIFLTQFCRDPESRGRLTTSWFTLGCSYSLPNSAAIRSHEEDWPTADSGLGVHIPYPTLQRSGVARKTHHQLIHSRIFIFLTQFCRNLEPKKTDHQLIHSWMFIFLTQFCRDLESRGKQTTNWFTLGYSYSLPSSVVIRSREEDWPTADSLLDIHGANSAADLKKHESVLAMYTDKCTVSKAPKLNRPKNKFFKSIIYQWRTKMSLY
jgi:hypothetical protein